VSACSHTIYIVRHAEKQAADAAMTTDVSLSPEGKERAITLKQKLANKRIRYVYSTNTIRTVSTARPIADYLGLTINIYPPKPDSVFFQNVKSIKGNVLIIGHSNTVGDIVNRLCGKELVPAELNDNEYDNLFVIKKKGSKVLLKRRKYGNQTE
jgi:phosphohistidine phosphatase SixA